MAFAKAEQLLDLATLAAGLHEGVSLEMAAARFGVSHRTAQRMMRALEQRFPDIEIREDGAGRRRWRLAGGALRELLTLSADELALLDLAAGHLRHAGLAAEAAALGRLRDKVRALVPRRQAARLESDTDALLEAQGFVARPGPRPRVDDGVAAIVVEAIKACRVIEILYRSSRDPAPRPRLVAPYGVLSGQRRYLVGRPADDPDGPVRTYRLDVVQGAAPTPRFFERPARFDLEAFARRSFGVFQADHEYGEVVWRFAPDAAEQARGTLFHPDQRLEPQPDGSLIVRFQAAGHLEMAWYLYAWGNRVEVLAPSRLADLVRDHRRGDFPALP